MGEVGNFDLLPPNQRGIVQLGAIGSEDVLNKNTRHPSNQTDATMQRDMCIATTSVPRSRSIVAYEPSRDGYPFLLCIIVPANQVSCDIRISASRVMRNNDRRPLHDPSRRDL
ncbi:hypothetical protein M758_UG132400 [Ceratodon purpureus]|nr:hypothetical protein M758_UG132400 [Ceratodon purpureus]